MRVADLLVVNRNREQGHGQNRHRREHRPTLAGVAHHVPERIGQRGGNEEECQHLEEVRQRRRILVGMGGIGVEEPAAVGAELLDRLLRGHRAHGQRLRPGRQILQDRIASRILDGIAGRIHLGLLVRERLDRSDILVGAEALHDPLADETEGEDDRKREQDVQCRAGHIDPEIADRADAVTGKTADERYGDDDAGCGREEILDRKPRHLRQIAQGGLAGIPLPVRIRDEAHRRVERRVRRDSGELLRVQRQPPLQPLQGVDAERPECVEDEQRNGILLPAHLLCRIDAAQPIDQRFQPSRDTQRPDRPSVHDVGDVQPDGLHAQQHHGEENGDQRHRCGRHQNFSGLNIA